MSSWWERVRDQGVFVSQAVSGDLAISARLTSLAPNVGGPNAYQWDNRPSTTAGLMIRESLDQACGRYLLVQIEASGNLVCRWRNKTGDQDDNQVKELGKVTLPVHIKLVQAGKQVQVFASADGQSWGQPRMSHTVTFDTTSRIGLFVCSGNTFSSSTATFDSVTVKEL
jgi:regulation of enolase protein 1 (concanavalin A-like superfamily)